MNGEACQHSIRNSKLTNLKMSLCLLSATEFLVAVKTHIAYVNIEKDNLIQKCIELPEEKPVKTENEEQEPIVLPPGRIANLKHVTRID